jgi:hypothetical protein
MIDVLQLLDRRTVRPCAYAYVASREETPEATCCLRSNDERLLPAEQHGRQ